MFHESSLGTTIVSDSRIASEAKSSVAKCRCGGTNLMLKAWDILARISTMFSQCPASAYLARHSKGICRSLCLGSPSSIAGDVVRA